MVEHLKNYCFIMWHALDGRKLLNSYFKYKVGYSFTKRIQVYDI